MSNVPPMLALPFVNVTVYESPVNVFAYQRALAVSTLKGVFATIEQVMSEELPVFL